MRKFFKQVIQVTVLSKDVPLEWVDLSEVERAIDQGDCVGKVEEISSTPLTGKEAADALTEFGSEPGFFRITEDGNDDDDDEDLEDE
jgi:hypothetical protein